MVLNTSRETNDKISPMREDDNKSRNSLSVFQQNLLNIATNSLSNEVVNDSTNVNDNDNDNNSYTFQLANYRKRQNLNLMQVQG